MCLIYLQLFDRISSKVVSPVRAPPGDGVQRARDAADALREMDHRRDADHRDLQELRDLLCRPHFKVGNILFSCCFKINIITLWTTSHIDGVTLPAGISDLFTNSTFLIIISPFVLFLPFYTLILQENITQR